MSNEILNSLLKEYEQKKFKSEIDLEKRKSDLYTKIPKLKEIEDELNHYAINTAKSILNHENSSLNSLQEKINELKMQKEKILKSENLDNNYLKPFYECELCQDTGYIKDNNYKSKMCNCLKQKLLDYSFHKSNMTNLNRENFSNFNENLFSDKINVEKYKFDISPRSNICNIKDRCIYFIENFDDPNTNNLLFSGNTGLRKDIYVKLYRSRITKKRKNCTLSDSSYTS